jgi:hypothetical protein
VLAEFYTLGKDPIQKATWISKYKKAIDEAIHNVLDNQGSLSKQQQQLAIQRALGPQRILPQDVQRLKNDLYDILKEIRDKEHMYRVSQMYKIIIPPIPLRNEETIVYKAINELKGGDMNEWHNAQKYFIVDWDGDHATCTPELFTASTRMLTFEFYEKFYTACCITIKRLLRHFKVEANLYFVRVVLVLQRNAFDWHTDDDRDNRYSGLIFLPPPTTAAQQQFVLSTQYGIPVKQIQGKIGGLSPRLQRLTQAGQETIVLRQRVPFFRLTGHVGSVMHRSPPGQRDRFLAFTIEPLTEKSRQKIGLDFKPIQGLEPCRI